ncbi:MAG: two pore domain potassium channel family protein [Sphingobacteriales bacterium]|nr:MAG: two pore domain potassium channel family protein [Sphingobacteriales bacterium]
MQNRKSRHKPLPPATHYHNKLLRGFAVSMFIIFLSLGLGIAGYHFFGHLNFVDSLLNASMILTGMGPVNPMTSIAGKIFASIYALYSGLAFLVIVGFTFAPAYQRFMHRFHLSIEDTDEEEKGKLHK